MPPMNDEQFTRALQSVGQSCFIKYYHVFSSSSLSREDVIERLKSETGYTENSCISRLGHARRIINAGFTSRALETIVNSPRSSSETKTRAVGILTELNGDLNG